MSEFPDRKINIFQLVNGFAIGGAETKLYQLVSHVDRRRINVTVCSVGQGGPLQERFEALGVRVKVFPKKYAFDWSLIPKVARFMQEEHAHIVQTTLLYADIIGALAARWAKIPITISWETVSHGQNDPLRQKPRHRLAYQFAMNFVEKIVAVSDYTRRSIIENSHIPPSKVVTIPYGVDIRRFQQKSSSLLRKSLGIDAGTAVIGTVARLEIEKGHTYLIQAVARIAAHFPSIKCLVVGDGSLRPKLEAETAQYGLKEKFLFLGFRNDIDELLRVFDVFVLPSITEGLPNVILEAMATGIPVVASRVGGIPEPVIDRETGFLVPPKNPEALAQALRVLLADKAKAAEMGRLGRRRIEASYTLDREIEQFQQLYETLLEHHDSKRTFE